MRFIYRFAGVAIAAVALSFSAGATAQGQSAGGPGSVAPLVIDKVRGDIYLIGGAGGNITVQIGDSGVLLVDTGIVENSAAVLAAVRSLTPTPVTMIINTSYDLDHTGGNAAISASARSPVAFWYSAGGAVANHANVWAHENTLARLSARGKDGQPLIPRIGQPLDSYFSPQQDLFFNGEAVQLYHTPRGHTDGDSMVFFRRTDVIAAGDVFSTSRYPVIRESDGGSIDGVIAALNQLVDLGVPDRNVEGGTLVIPGHGHLADEYEVANYRDAVTIIRDRISALIKRGMSLEQVKKERPTLDWDGQFGTNEGSWTTEMFVEAVYRNLQGER